MVKRSTANNHDFADLTHIFNPRSVAIIGASEKPGKVGQVIMQNYMDAGFQGALYPVNINAGEKISGYKAYKSVLDIRKEIDLVVIAIPAAGVPNVLEECGKAKANGAVIVSGGFAEVGAADLEEKIKQISKKYKMPFIGPNCLGVMDPRARIDTLFLPTYKIERPKIGGVSFVSQSGSVGSSTLDLISAEGFGLSRFISYGNATVVDEVDILHFLAKDKNTKVIVYYLEGAKRGREFIEVAKEVTKSKPVVIIKGGITETGATAAHSHTASLAGSYESYSAVFRQFGMTEAHELEELIYFAKIFDTQPLVTGNRVAVITNGGGHGVLATDAIYQNGLTFPQLTKESQKELRRRMPPIVNIALPMDVGGEADYKRFGDALEVLSTDQNVDAIMMIALFQTPGADEKLVDAVVNFNNGKKKPLVVVSTGSSYTQSHTKLMESAGVPVYESPSAAAKALAALISYSRYREKAV